jgi:hypothetical protein
MEKPLKGLLPSGLLSCKSLRHDQNRAYVVTCRQGVASDYTLPAAFASARKAASRKNRQVSRHGGGFLFMPGLRNSHQRGLAAMNADHSSGIMPPLILLHCQQAGTVLRPFLCLGIA